MQEWYTLEVSRLERCPQFSGILIERGSTVKDFSLGQCGKIV